MSEILKETKTIVADKIQITGFSINTFPVDSRHMVVTYLIGFDDSEGNFKTIELPKQFAIHGAQFDALVSSNPDASISFYENIKIKLYNLILQG